MRHRLIARLLCAAVWISGAALGCSWFKSNNDAPPPSGDEQANITVPDGTPAELGAAMRDAAGAVDRLVSHPSSSAGPLDDEKLAEQLATGIKAADKLMAHPEAAPEQVDDARKAKLALLYVGTQQNRPRFQNQFGEFVQELIDEVPDAPIAAIGRAALIEVEHIAADESPESVLPLLTGYANNYPNREEGIRLFESYADSLARRGKRDAALRCCRLGIEYYKNHSLVGRLRLKLRQIEHMPPDRR
jgi:hypothetical protein